MNILYYTLLIIVVCVISIDTRPAKQPAKQPTKQPNLSCVDTRGTLLDPGRVPSEIKNLTCRQNPECYSVSASLMVIYKNSSKTETLSVVVACLKRVKCPNNDNIKVSQDIDPTRKPAQFVYKSFCNKPEDEIFIMLPTINNAALVYKKVVYDCRCPCSGK